MKMLMRLAGKARTLRVFAVYMFTCMHPARILYFCRFPMIVGFLHLDVCWLAASLLQVHAVKCDFYNGKAPRSCWRTWLTSLLPG